jgi:acetylornithine deacetylase/succinyl-diaminopimelate desuccinylase-like protein
MSDVLSLQPDVAAAVSRLPSRHAALLDLCVAIQQIPAPTFNEGQRAGFIEARFRALGLSDVAQDSLHNVVGRLPGRGEGKALLLSAHLDTVFPATADLRVRVDEEAECIWGPGVGDNSAGVAGLLQIAEVMRELPPPPVDVWFAANVGEEGLGDLCGMRAVVDQLRQQVGAAIVIEGMGLGRIVHRGLGSRRFRIAVNAPGGHSWSAFGMPSAVHTIVQLADKLTHLDVPTYPRTTFNIGRINGGTSINSIAEHAWLELDLRSESTTALESVVAHTLSIVRRFQSHHWRERGVHVVAETIGDRPTGSIPADHPLVRLAERALNAAGVEVESGERMSSTDANIPLSRGIPAVCVGITTGGNAHRMDEWISTPELRPGMQHLLTLVWWAAGWLAGQGGAGK